MDNYNKKHVVYHMTEGNLIPKFDDEIQQKIQYMINTKAISINIELKQVVMLDPVGGLGNLSDDEILKILLFASHVGKAFQDSGWHVKY